MKILRPFLYLILALILAFGIFLLYSSIDDYRPDEISILDAGVEVDILQDTVALNLVIWNIGYAGLDASMDFFYDGGEQMRPSKEGVENNMKGISQTLEGYRDYDFILLQEVDKKSKRSYRINEYEAIAAQFEGYHSYFGTNYKVDFVPIPLSGPMGRVESGLMTVSKYRPASVQRHSFPGNYGWPISLFMLDRCFLVSRYPVGDNKYLLLINTHNSAYDDGSLRAGQMAYLSTFLLNEYQKGNYVIVGGDWNQTPYGIDPVLPDHQFDTIALTYVEKDYPAKDWQWFYDLSLPTNRRVARPYDKATTPTTIIDCFLCSPNVSLKEIRTIDLDFAYSDHQPVVLQVRLEL